jgi:hypothetical protein
VVNGTYTVNTPLNSTTNTIGLTVTVTTPGSYNISGSLNGMTFTASGIFAAAGAAPVTLTGAGNPTTAGSNSIPLTGASAGCSVAINVQPAAGGPAVYTVDCSTANINGVYVKGMNLVTTVNTVDIDVNVTTPGPYTITGTGNGMTFTASSTFAAPGVQTITLAGSGAPTTAGILNITISGTGGCSFPLETLPSLGTWSFTAAATNYSGPIFEASFEDPGFPPAIAFYFLGTTPVGDLFEIDMVDLNGSIAANETYNCAPPVTGNAGGVYYDGVTGTSYYGDPADPTLATNTMSVKITSHNTATKTIVGTFSGNALLNGGTTLTAITNGQFTVTYP